MKSFLFFGTFPFVFFCGKGNPWMLDPNKIFIHFSYIACYIAYNLNENQPIEVSTNMFIVVKPRNLYPWN